MQWWKNLTTRERYMIGVGGVVVVGLLFYFYIWTPINASIERRLQQVQSQQPLIGWMSHASVQVRALRAAGFKKIKPSTSPLLVLVEKSLAEQKLSNFISGIQQPDNNQLQITFASAPFDAVMTWLQMLWQQSGVNVTQFDVARTDTAGLVAMKITLKK